MALGLGINNAPLLRPLDWSPLDTDNCLFWYKNNTNVSTDGWLDSSPNENHTLQVVEDNQPALYEGGLRFDGENDRLDLQEKIEIEFDQPFTIALTFKLSSLSNNCILSDSNAEFFEIQSQSRIRFKGNIGASTVSVLVFDENIFEVDRPISLIFKRDSNQRLDTYVNGVLVVPNAGESTNITNKAGFDIYNISSRNDNDRFFHGVIYEMFLYGKELSQTHHANSLDYLNDKFNT